MSDDSKQQHREGEQPAASYEPPRVEDIPADGPAVTAAGANNAQVSVTD